MLSTSWAAAVSWRAKWMTSADESTGQHFRNCPQTLFQPTSEASLCPRMGNPAVQTNSTSWSQIMMSSARAFHVSHSRNLVSNSEYETRHGEPCFSTLCRSFERKGQKRSFLRMCEILLAPDIAIHGRSSSTAFAMLGIECQMSRLFSLRTCSRQMLEEPRKYVIGFLSCANVSRM